MRRFVNGSLCIPDGLLTDALGERYGRITARVVRHDAREREAHLVDSDGVTRTYSVTFLSRPMPAAFAPINEAIRSGRLIGEAFRDHGYTIRRNVLDVFVVESPRWLRDAFRVKDPYAWARVFEFHARKGTSAPRVYGTLCEIFTPDFKPPIVTPTDVSWLGPGLPGLRACGFTPEEAWRRIGHLEDGKNVNGRFFQARLATLPVVFGLRKKVIAHLAGS